MKSNLLKSALLLTLIPASTMNWAGEVTGLTTFQANTTAKASEVNGNFTAIQDAVNDNNTRITTNETAISGHETRISTNEANISANETAVIDHETRISSNESDIGDHEVRISNNASDIANLNGILKTALRGNLSPAPAGATGYVNVYFADDLVTPLTYLSPTNAIAQVDTRCGYDADSAGVILTHRAALRNITEGTISIGKQLYIRSVTAAANQTVMNVNSDIFLLTAGQEYDFGVYFKPDETGSGGTGPRPSPSGGSNDDICSVVVMVYRNK